MVEPYFDSIPASDEQFGQHNPEELQVNDVGDHGSEAFAPGYLFPGELGGVEDNSWLDQAMMDIGMQAFDQVDVSPNAAVTDQASGSLTAQPHEESISIVCGLTGDMDPYLMQRYNFDSNNNFVFKRLTVRSMSQDVHPVQLLMFNASEETKTTATDTAREHLERLVSPDVGSRLIVLYYQFVHPHVPVIPLTTPPNPTRSYPSLLAAIYLVTLSFAGFDDYLSVQIAYDLPDTEKLWDLALSGTQQGLHKPNFAMLQMVILLLVAPSPNPLMPDYSTKWSLVGTMVTVSQTLGLQFDASDWKISLAELELRKRLSWVVEMIDVWHAAVLGRTCLIREDSWLVKEPQLTDFSDQESQMSRHLIHMYKLTAILRQVLNTLFSLKAVQILVRDYDITLRNVQVSMEELNRWSIVALEIESEAKFEDVNLSGPMLLGGHFVKVLLFRAILRPFQTTSRSADSLPADPRELEAHRLSRAGAKACVTSFVAFTADLRSGWINGFWPFWCTLAWSTLCNLALMLHVSAETIGEAQECQISLDRARKAIRLHAKSLDVLRFSLLRIDSIFWKGLDNVLTTRLEQSAMNE